MEPSVSDDLMNGRIEGINGLTALITGWALSIQLSISFPRLISLAVLALSFALS
jgi:hypothetical protein